MYIFDRKETKKIQNLLIDLEGAFTLTRLALADSKGHSVMKCFSTTNRIEEEVLRAEKIFKELKKIADINAEE
jgi:hypothetical protein